LKRSELKVAKAVEAEGESPGPSMKFPQFFTSRSVELVVPTPLPPVVLTAVEPQVAQQELKAQVEAPVISALAFRYLRELLSLAVVADEVLVLDQVVEPAAV
jgi:hypothetical protein